MSQVVYTKDFNQAFRALSRSGKRIILQKVNAVLVQAAMGEDITAAQRTHHGEDRIKNAEKFDLGDGYRMVTQIIRDDERIVRVFHFVGSHDEAERWFEVHRGQKFVYRKTDRRLDMIPVDVPAATYIRMPNPDVAEEVASIPLFRYLTDDDWRRLDVPNRVRAQLLTYTNDDYTNDAVLEDLKRLPISIGELLFDVMISTNEGDIHAVRARIDLYYGGSKKASDKDIMEAVALPINSERFITFSDPAEVKELLRRDSWEDWMLFLASEQSEIVERVFSGPARVRGVSGSGKTSVLLHHARVCARRYQSRVLVVTLTRSLTNLLDHLLDGLCGAERNLVVTCSITEIAGAILEAVTPTALRAFRALKPEAYKRYRSESLTRAGVFKVATANGTHGNISQNSILDEFTYVRETYLPTGRTEYLQMVGERFPEMNKPELFAQCLLSAIDSYERLLAEKRAADDETLVMLALEMAHETRGCGIIDFDNPSTLLHPFARCVLADEAQDLSANELRLLASLTDLAKTDSFFLAADDAQRIIRQTSGLARLRIDFGANSFVLKKNYRNTMQILRAARRLIDHYNIHELEDSSQIIPVDYATREGGPPEIIRFPDWEEERNWVAHECSRLLTQEAAAVGAGILVLAANAKLRDSLSESIRAVGLNVEVLRNDVLPAAGTVKVSTVESAKGHEFSIVFIVGMKTGVLPHANLKTTEIKREASRLYVAMTRARERVVLTWNREERGRPSVFLTILMDTCREGRWDKGKLLIDKVAITGNPNAL
jgi:superfamily I DNA/RNA helicase